MLCHDLKELIGSSLTWCSKKRFHIFIFTLVITELNSLDNCRKRHKTQVISVTNGQKVWCVREVSTLDSKLWTVTRRKSFYCVLCMARRCHVLVGVCLLCVCVWRGVCTLFDTISRNFDFFRTFDTHLEEENLKTFAVRISPSIVKSQEEPNTVVKITFETTLKKLTSWIRFRTFFESDFLQLTS